MSIKASCIERILTELHCDVLKEPLEMVVSLWVGHVHACFLLHLNNHIACFYMYTCMWMDGSVDGWMDGWMDGQTYIDGGICARYE